VTSQVAAAAYYLSYVVTVSGDSTVRNVYLMKQGTTDPIRTYTAPADPSTWPSGVESLAYYLAFKDADGAVQSVDGSSNHLVLLNKSIQAFTDPTNDKDVVIQGSYRGDTIDLSGTATDTFSSNIYKKSYGTDVRVTIKGNQGTDTITGHEGSDFVQGQGSPDIISTGGGNDKIFIGGVASATAETIDGGADTDTVVVTLHGADATVSINANAESLTLLSAPGTWTGDEFESSGQYTSDYTLSVNSDGKLQVVSESGSSTYSSSGNTSVLTSIEQIEIRMAGSGERFTGTLGVGTTENDNLTAGDVLWALGGDDNISVVSDSVVFAGAGDDILTLASSYMFNAENSALLLGGAGIDTLKLSDTAQPTTPSSSWNFDFQQFEIFDMTGAGNNTLATSVQDLLGQGNTTLNLWGIEGGDGKLQFMAKGDSGDTVEFQGGTFSAQPTTATVNGTVFDVWTDSESNLQLLLQQGVTVIPVL
jgi:Ca2+-binding RTX toxin-like protein